MIIVLFALSNTPQVMAASTTGYMGTPSYLAPPLPHSGTKTDTMGTYDLPDKGNVTFTRTDAHWSTRFEAPFPDVQPPTTDLKAGYLSLGFNPVTSYVPAVYHQVASTLNPGTVTMQLSRPTSKIAIVIMDVDNQDVVNVAAKDADGNIYSDLSSWDILGSGDMSVATTPGTDPAPAPTFNAATGTFTSADTTNSNRAFYVLQPNERISEISFTLDSDIIGNHVYYSLYSLLEEPLSLGNTVWNDANNNGLRDNGEAGLKNVALSLYDSSNNLISTTTTNSNGEFLFSNLDAGSYYIVVNASNFASNGSLYNFRSSNASGFEPPSGFGYNQDSGYENSDYLANGVRTNTITLEYEAAPLGGGNSNLSAYLNANFGFYSVGPASTQSNNINQSTLPSTGVNNIRGIIIGGAVIIGITAGTRLRRKKTSQTN